MNRVSKQWKLVLMATTLAFAIGCTSSSAPFHMYSSPLLEGEMEPPRGGANFLDDEGSSPGVEPRQVYVYQRWNTEEYMAPQRRRIQPGTSPSQGPPLDTVFPSSTPVLANYDSNTTESTVQPASTAPVGAGRTVDNGGASPDSSGSDREVQGEETASAEVESVEETIEEIDEEVRSQAPDESEVQQFESSTVSAGYIHTVLAVNGIEFDDSASNSIPNLYRACRTEGKIYHSSQPDIGDVVFFHNTYDANNDGRNNNWYTLVGIVEEIHRDGTVDFLAYRGDEVETLHLNLNELDHREGSRGRTINSELRAPTAQDAPFTQYLSGQLFAGFCNVLGDSSELVLIDNWTPGMTIE